MMMAAALIVAVIAYLAYDQFIGQQEEVVEEEREVIRIVDQPAPATQRNPLRPPDQEFDMNVHSIEQNLWLRFNEIEQFDDGRAFLTPFQCEMQGSQEVIITCDRAETKFKKKLKLEEQEAVGRPTYAKLMGNVRVWGDRETPTVAADDFQLLTSLLIYDESKKRIDTPAAVRIIDGRSVITGRGMVVDLLEQKPRSDPETGEAPARQLAIKGILLQRDVVMELQLKPEQLRRTADAGSGRPATQPTEPVRLTIRCDGSFRYQPEQMQAVFDENVRVVRHANKAQDKMELEADKLVFVFRQTPEDAAGAGSDSFGLELVEGIATGEKVVVLTEGSRAEGTKFTYDMVADRGLLTGSPEVRVFRDQSQLRARRMTFDRTTGEALVEGAGSLVHLDPDAPADRREVRARWTHQARFEEHEGGDRLTLVGKVHLEQGTETALDAGHVVLTFGKSGDGTATDGQDTSRQIRKLVATDNVDLRQPGSRIKASKRVTVIFIDEAKPEPGPTRPAPTTRPRPTAPRPEPTPPEPDKPSKPKYIEAEEVIAVVVRGKKGNELRNVETSGVVQIRSAPEDEPVEITSDRLELVEDPDGKGNRIRVHGSPAIISQGELRIVGELIVYDPESGLAEVPGPGLLSFPADRDFQGKDLSGAARTTITWSTKMRFEGREGHFEGKVHAEQPGSHLWCDRLKVTMAKGSSLGEGEPGSGAKRDVEYLQCEGRCLSVAIQKQEGFLVVKREMLQAPEIIFDNRQKQIRARGPGLYESVQRGSAKEGDAPAPQGAFGSVRQASPSELGCHVVLFEESMLADVASDQGTFIGRVRVLYGNLRDTATDSDVSRLLGNLGPTVERKFGPPGLAARPKPALAIASEDALPADGMLLVSDRFSVRQRKVVGDDGTRSGATDLDAFGNVFIRSGAFRARGARITYDQIKGQVVIVGQLEDYAVLWRRYKPGGPFDQIVAQKLLFYPRQDRLRAEQQQFLNAGMTGERNIGFRP